MAALSRDLKTAATQTFDVAVIGGGITGAGIARHASAAGASVVLVEASDFASGTSSRSTKLIHGGLRYLAMGDIKLVRSGVRERAHLATMAPHLCQPCWMVVPARSRAAMLKLRAGIGVYEKLGPVGKPDQHKNWRAEDLALNEPLLDGQRFPFACVYREYLTDDARLVLATLRAAAGHGATVLNYVQVTACRQDSQGCTLTVVDTEADESFEIRARSVVNAAGPWVESLLGRLDAKGARRHLHLSKGVHLVLARRRLPIENPIMMTAADGRPVFAIPRGEVTYVGTTDTTHAGGPEHWPRVEPQDVSYLLRTLSEHFVGAELDGAAVLTSWAGLRPLVDQPGKAPKEISRRDEIWRSGRMLSIAGGKLTGFRLMAEQAMSALESVLNRRLTMPDPLELLPGAVEDVAGLVDDVASRYQLEGSVAERLVRLYGSEVFSILGDRPRPVSSSVFAEEVDWALAEESALHVEDVVYRRTGVAWFRPQEAEDLARCAAEKMAAAASWSQDKQRQELTAVRSRLSGDRQVR